MSVVVVVEVAVEETSMSVVVLVGLAVVENTLLVFTDETSGSDE